MDFCRAFAQGCGGRISTNPKMLTHGDVAGFWLPELLEILDQAIAEGRNWYYGDKAYFDRTKYFRITKNAKMLTHFEQSTPERFNKLGLSIKPWREGSDILLCPQSDTFFRRIGTTQADWILNTSKAIRQYSDRKIRVNLKHAGNDTEQFFRGQLGDTHAVVVHSSIAGVQAAIEGVPCFATDSESTAVKFGTMDLSLMENPIKPDNREQMAWALADNQWTLNEIRSGMAWEAIK
jgi:hypothetical protein